MTSDYLHRLAFGMVRRMCLPGGTGCTFVVSTDPPMTCGFAAVAPHPDPDISYREAFCPFHLPEVVGAHRRSNPDVPSRSEPAG